MRTRAICWAFSQTTGSPVSKLILIKIADSANEDGRCNDSVRTIAKHCEMHPRTVERHIADLAEAGFLSVGKQFREGSQTNNSYRVNLEFSAHSNNKATAKARYKKRIGPSLRLKVYKKDGYCCVMCNSSHDLSLDHIIPESKGGASTIDNLQTMCMRCNSVKGVK